MISRSHYRRFWKELKASDNFLITTHINPDGDGLCSMLIMAKVLRSFRKRYFIVMEDLFPQRYRFLFSHFSQCVIPEYIQVPPDSDLKDVLPESFNPETLLVIDTHSIFRLGQFAQDIPGLELKKVFTIDHHKGKSRLPHTLELSDSGVSSTSEIIYSLLKTGGFRINRCIAELLYIAIATDTKSFSQSNTTSSTHRIASDLLRTGIKPEEISYYFQEMPAVTMKVFGRVISRLKLELRGQAVWSYITKKELGQCANADVDGLIEMIRNVKGTKIALLFKEVDENKIKVCLRGKRDFNVFRIAKVFDGGGHLQASGFLIGKKMKESIRIVLKKIQSYL
ncbi:MAG: bifunctional oligoribonuclease/PAP phosphatase NrnA [bacterium]|nr:bifunctional oligoribonuclease/PAP phosphatase NrnA [bacterium]